MKRSPSCAIATTALSILLTVSASAADNPFVSNWALLLPDGHASWLGITQQKDYHDASLLREGGSVVPLDSAILYDGAFAFICVHDVPRKNAAGKVVRKAHSLRMDFGSSNKEMSASAFRSPIQFSSYSCNDLVRSMLLIGNDSPRP